MAANANPDRRVYQMLVRDRCDHWYAVGEYERMVTALESLLHSGERIPDE